MGFLLYVFFIIGSIEGLLTFVTVIAYLLGAMFGIIILVYYCAYWDALRSEKDKKRERAEKIFKKLKPYTIKSTIVAFCIQLVVILIPEPKQIAAIYVIPKIMKNQDIQEIPANIAKLANEGIKELIEFTKNEAVEKAKEEIKKK